jgi:adenylylsulfate reductase subunit A
MVYVKLKDFDRALADLQKGDELKPQSAFVIYSIGEVYEGKYGVTTSQRVHGTVRENAEGRGPCYLRTAGITPDQDEELYRAYLNMSPSQTLKWIESGLAPSAQNVEIEGTEPYIVGGHTASGYWVDTGRETTIAGLFAAGDVAGGCPQKYVTGAFAEGEIAAKSALKYMNCALPSLSETETDAARRGLEDILNLASSADTVDSLEAEMQAAMDEYAGGIGAGYAFSEESLAVAARKIGYIELRSEKLAAKDMRELVYIFELRDRLTICKSVIAHLAARRETRWHSFAENTDHPEKSEQWLKFVNSRLENGKIKIILRDLVKRGDQYEH